MGLEEVKKGLEQELEQRKAELRREAEEERKRILDKAREEVAQYREKTVKQTDEIISMLEKSEIASSNLKVNKDLLNVKKEAIDEVFEEAKKRLYSLSDEKKKKILKSLVDQAKKEIDVKFVYCNKEEVKLVDGSNILAEDISGGVICESADKTSRVDLTFDTLLHEVREQNLKEVAEKLLQ